MGGYTTNINNIQSWSGWDIQQSFSFIFPINFVCKWGKEILEQWVGYKGWGGVVTNYEIASTFICNSKKNFIKLEIISF